LLSFSAHSGAARAQRSVDSMPEDAVARVSLSGQPFRDPVAKGPGRQTALQAPDRHEPAGFCRTGFGRRGRRRRCHILGCERGGDRRCREGEDLAPDVGGARAPAARSDQFRTCSIPEDWAATNHRQRLASSRGRGLHEKIKGLFHGSGHGP
jgi:hypothetical protein